MLAPPCELVVATHWKCKKSINTPWLLLREEGLIFNPCQQKKYLLLCQCFSYCICSYPASSLGREEARKTGEGRKREKGLLWNTHSSEEEDIPAFLPPPAPPPTAPTPPSSSHTERRNEANGRWSFHLSLLYLVQYFARINVSLCFMK